MALAISSLFIFTTLVRQHGIGLLLPPKAQWGGHQELVTLRELPSKESSRGLKRDSFSTRSVEKILGRILPYAHSTDAHCLHTLFLYFAFSL